MDGLHSVPELLALHGREGFLATVETNRSERTTSLLRHVETTENALALWATHLALDAREVPPCLRPRRDEQPQLAFLTWLADVLWFTRRNRAHKPLFKSWAGLFRNEPNRVQWHKVALWVYRSGHRQPYYHAKGLGLTAKQRQPLMTMVSDAMRKGRRTLQRLPELRERLLGHALTHPDRAGVHSAGEVAQRRVQVLRAFVLACRNRSVAANYYEHLTGERMSRQTLTRHLEAIEVATGMRLLRSG